MKNKSIVRDYEKKTRDGQATKGYENEYDAGQVSKTEKLWARIKNLLNLEDEKNVARQAFRDACERYTDNRQGTVLSLDKIKQAFNAAFLFPMPTDDEFCKLFTALEVWKDEDLKLVRWPEILKATLRTEDKLVVGYFPKILQKSDQNAEKLE